MPNGLPPCGRGSNDKMSLTGHDVAMRELLRYVLWQLPSWGLVGLILIGLAMSTVLSARTSALIFCLLVAKDLALFPVMRVAYRPSAPASWPIGQRGRAIEPLEPSGYICVSGELWRAEVRQAGKRVSPGSAVVVRGARGLTLLVEEETEGSARER